MGIRLCRHLSQVRTYGTLNENICSQLQGASGSCEYTIRESRYPMFLRRKNATRGSGVDRKAEMASIGKSRGSLIDPRTEQSQVAIEAAISEGTQFDSHGGGILHDAA